MAGVRIASVWWIWILCCAAGAAVAHACEACRMLGSSAAHSGAPLPPSVGPQFSLSVPVLNSLPGAHVKLYLDFDGDVTPQWQGYAPGTTPAYSIDADPATFSTQELINIEQIFSRVSEKFSPFSINVTTVDPGNLNDLETVQVVIGGSGQWVGSTVGGIAALGGFYLSTMSNKAFVFSSNLANGDPKRVGEASSHETGHEFGLQHQSLYNAQGALLNEYNPGNPLKAPVMGNSYSSARGLWWRGPSFAPTAIQDDLASITRAGTGIFYRADDHADLPAGATPLALSGNSVSGAGIITRIADVDYFSFETLAGEVALQVGVPSLGPMLDASLSLFDSTGQLIASSATAGLSESIFRTLSAGNYSLAVRSAGNYGDIGQYFITGTIVAVPEPLCAALLLPALPYLTRRRRVNHV